MSNFMPGEYNPTVMIANVGGKLPAPQALAKCFIGVYLLPVHHKPVTRDYYQHHFTNEQTGPERLGKL